MISTYISIVSRISRAFSGLELTKGQTLYSVELRYKGRVLRDGRNLLDSRIASKKLMHDGLLPACKLTFEMDATYLNV